MKKCFIITTSTRLLQIFKIKTKNNLALDHLKDAIIEIKIEEDGMRSIQEEIIEVEAEIDMNEGAEIDMIDTKDMKDMKEKIDTIDTIDMINMMKKIGDQEEDE